MKYLLFITLPFYGLDQLTKWLVMKKLEPGGDGHTVIPNFFELVYRTNTGAAFSAFSNNNGFFILLSTVVLVALAVFYWRGAFSGVVVKTGFALLVAGILGNLTDRILHQCVIDFLSFDLHVRYANPWPTFNIADSCICVAAVIFIITSFREEKKKTTQQQP